jgi:manganese/zinc/iron transport system permease protein
MSLADFLTFDLPAILTALFASLACGLLGNFLLLRRQCLMGDAISHSVLPGLVGGFIVFQSRGALPMFLGAAAAGIAAVVLIELVRRIGRVDPGAAMGVVFSVFFALGVVLVSLHAREVDLDPDCVLNGILETVFWSADPAAGTRAPTTLASLTDPAVLAGIPRQVVITGAVAAASALFVGLLFKELRIAAFDPDLATALGFRAGALSHALMVLVAAAVVAAFEAVGSILVVAMLVVPPATARLLTDRLSTQVWLSALVASLAAVAGYVAGAHAPVWLGARHALSAAGMITVTGGVLLLLALVFAPAHGAVPRALRRTALAVTIAREDLLAMLYRLEEEAGARGAPAPALSRTTPSAAPLAPSHARRALAAASASRLAPALAIRSAKRRGLVTSSHAGLALTPAGRADARRLVRTHRLWETYLVRELGLRPDHVHRTAMDLEHLTSPGMQDELAAAPGQPAVDPQGKPIPDR